MRGCCIRAKVAISLISLFKNYPIRNLTGKSLIQIIGIMLNIGPDGWPGPTICMILKQYHDKDNGLTKQVCL